MKRHLIDLSRWRNRIASWQKHGAPFLGLGDKQNIARLTTGVWSRISKLIVPAIQSLIIIFFWTFFQPSSIWFWISSFCTLLLFGLMEDKRYRMFALIFIMLVSTIAAVSLSAAYQIASAEHRFQYRVVDGISYFEFPEHFPYLKGIATKITGRRLITVTTCDNQRVAVLPLLPQQPIFLEHNFIDRTGFRRLPEIKFERLQLNIKASVNLSSPPHGSFHLVFGFSSTEDASIPLTWIFPRSMKCQQNNIPLIPILEVLPWQPDNVGSLVEAADKVNTIRAAIADHSISFDQLRKMSSTADDTPYSALFDFVTYSMMYQMFDGNIFSELSAGLANAACRVADSYSNAFSGPYAALPENFTRRLVAQIKSKIREIAPACIVSDDLIKAYEKIDPNQPSPFVFGQTFSRCVDTKTPMDQCLAAPDVVTTRRQTCEGVLCAIPVPPPAPDEMKLEDYDFKFYPLVETKENKLVSVDSIPPNKCPDFRDKQENKHFVDWWLDNANKITEEAGECSLEWQEKNQQAKKDFHSSLACAAKRDIRGAGYDETSVYLVDTLYAMKCTGGFGLDKDKFAGQLSTFFNQIDSIIGKLESDSQLLDEHNAQALIGAFELFRDTEQRLCGDVELKKCFEEYGVWLDYQRMLSEIATVLGLSDLGDNLKTLIDTVANRNNIIFNMAICDVLRDEELSKRSGYDRDSFCDSHGLYRYRMIGGELVTQTTTKERDDSSAGTSYIFESSGSDRVFEIRRFLDK